MAIFHILAACVAVTLVAAQSEPTLTANASEPAIVPGYSPDLAVECKVEVTEAEVMPVYLLLQRKADNSTVNMALQMVGRTTLMAEDDRFTLEGNMEERAEGETYVSVTIEGPVEADASLYRCEFVFFSNNQMSKLESTAEVSLQALPQGDVYIPPPLGLSSGNCCDINAAEIDELRLMISEMSPAVAGGAVPPVVTAAPGQCHAAFSATLREEIAYTVRSNRVLIFDRLDMDYGSAYDPMTGVFTAPCNGLYSFSLTLAAVHATGGTIDGIIRHGQDYKARTSTYSSYGGEQPASSSTTVTLRLSQGDTVDVFITATAQGNLLGLDSSVFTGHFLWA